MKESEVNFSQNVGHIITATVIIAAAVVLAALNKITGADAIAIIGTTGGVSLGGSVASSSGGTLAQGLAVGSTSVGTVTSAPTTTATPPAATTVMPGDVNTSSTAATP